MVIIYKIFKDVFNIFVFKIDSKFGNNNTIKSDGIEDPFGVAASLVPQSLLLNQKTDTVKNNSRMNC